MESRAVALEKIAKLQDFIERIDELILEDVYLNR